MNLSTVEVGYFNRCTSTKGGTNRPLLGLLEDIRGGRWRKEVEALRKLPRDSAAYSGAKKRLPCILLSATTHNGMRGSSGIGEHTGIIQADMDKLGGGAAVALRDKLASDPHVLATWLSPGGEGVKAAFRVEPSKEKHLQSFEAVRQHFSNIHGVEIDNQCKDITRLCFVSFDPSLVLNERAVTLPPLSVSSLGESRGESFSNSSTILPSTIYNLYNTPADGSALVWEKYPSLQTLYAKLVSRYWGQPEPGTRNEAIVEIVSTLFPAMAPSRVLVCVEAYWKEHEQVFWGYPLAEVLRQSECLLKGCSDSYPNRLSKAELEAFRTLRDERLEIVFRVCQNLSQCEADATCPPPFFFMGSEQLGTRLGTMGTSAWRLLKRLEKLGVIQTVKKGEKWERGSRPIATRFRWMLEPRS